MPVAFGRDLEHLGGEIRHFRGLARAAVEIAGDLGIHLGRQHVAERGAIAGVVRRLQPHELLLRVPREPVDVESGRKCLAGADATPADERTGSIRSAPPHSGGDDFSKTGDVPARGGDA